LNRTGDCSIGDRERISDSEVGPERETRKMGVDDGRRDSRSTAGVLLWWLLPDALAFVIIGPLDAPNWVGVIASLALFWPGVICPDGGGLLGAELGLGHLG
jgi:hypothetical protein